MSETYIEPLEDMHKECRAALAEARRYNHSYDIYEEGFALGWLMARGLDGNLAGELVYNGGFGSGHTVEFISRIVRRKRAKP